MNDKPLDERDDMRVRRMERLFFRFHLWRLSSGYWRKNIALAALTLALCAAVGIAMGRVIGA